MLNFYKIKGDVKMDIFSEIEGLSGENLSSALLSYLIFNSREIRDSMISLLSEKSPAGPITYSSHFACRAEYPTNDEKYGNGRLDILIQLDDAAVGIENKFFSSFQNNQPKKYLDSITSVANSLHEINKSETRSLLYILCPESRKEEAKKEIENPENTAIITWEEVISTIIKVDNVSDPVVKIVQREFLQYLKHQFSFIYDFERKVVHLRKLFPDYGTTLQEEVVRKLWSLFPSSGPRLSKGKTWLGYYFYPNPEIGRRGWFGFVNSEEIDGKNDNAAELIIASTYKPNGLSEGIKEVKLVNDNFIGSPGNTYYWIIDFDATWNNVDIWRETIKPFWDEVKETDE